MIGLRSDNKMEIFQDFCQKASEPPHFGQLVPESPAFQLQNGVSTSSLPPFIVDLGALSKTRYLADFVR